MNVLAAKLILTPLLIAAATLMARRWGPTVGGWVTGLPLTSGPVSVFLAVERGPAFAAAAAQATLLGLIAVVSLCVGYAWTAKRSGWLLSCSVGLLFYFLTVLILSTISLRTWVSLLVVYAVILAGTLMTGKKSVIAQIRTLYSSWDLPLRMVAATSMVLLITAVAKWIGPRWSGLLSPFPVFAAVMAVFSQRVGGGQAAIHFLHGVVVGSFAFAAFFVVVAQMIEHWSVLGSYSLAVLVAFLVNGISLMRILLRGRSSMD